MAPYGLSRATISTLLWLAFSFLFLPLVFAETAAREHTIGLSEVSGGSLLFKTGTPGRYQPAPTLHTDVRITVTGTIARATVRQEFTNPGQEKDDWAEGIYVFPLPDTAAVDHLRMTVDDRIIEGQIQERTEAKKRYERARQEGRRASLVEQERPNIFTTSVANIAPGATIAVEIEYQEIARYDQGAFSLRFPLVVGPRYISGTPVVIEDQAPGTGWSANTDRVPDASRITPPVLHPKYGAINPVSLTLDLAPGFPVGSVGSASHEILTIPAPDGRYHVTLREDRVPANRDFQLTWQAAQSLSPTIAAFTQQQGDDAYLFLMAMPPAGHAPALPPPARETIFVIDTSGSMAGPSLEQAKAALLLALNRLTTQDRFNVIQFNSVTHVLFSQAQPVSPKTLRTAVRYVDRLKATGGTEILPALKLALKGTAPATHLRQVIFLTDGQVGNDDELFEEIRANLGNSRLFTIGIGAAPNSQFMRKAAEFGRGSFTHIGSTSEVKAQMDALFRKLERPVLTDIQVEGFGRQTEMFPSPIPDLYDGEPIVTVVKGKQLPEALTVRGISAGQSWAATISLKDRESREGLSTYWARQKIAALMDRQRYGQEDAETRQAVVEVALAHHLVSKYTSLVAVDVTPVRPDGTLLQSHAMRTNLPEGQDYQAIFGLPRTATSGTQRILLGVASSGLALLLIAVAVRNRRTRAA